MKGLKAEYLKTKNTFTFWFTIGCALFVPIVMFLIYVFRYKHFIPTGDINPWVNFFKSNIKLVSTLFFPFYIVLTAALNLNVEHKSNSWKKILILPVSRTSILLNKGLFLLLQTIFAVLLFYLGTIFSGYSLGIIHPELKLLSYPPEIIGNLIFLSRLLLASLGILAIQYILSVFLKNMIVPITIGIVCVITAIVITTSWEYSAYFPYSFPAITYYDTVGEISITTWQGITISEWLSLATALVTMAVGSWLFKRKQLK